MGYIPKTIKCKMNLKNISDAEIMKNCTSKNVMETIKKFYQKLDGIELYLSLWDYDNKEGYHLSSWNDEFDNTMMEAFFILENDFGVYHNFKEFKSIYLDGEYDSSGTIVFPKHCVEELEVICEESNELSEREQLELLNSLKIMDYSACCGECEYILITDNEENRHILNRLGLTETNIKEECYADGGFLDISSISGRFATHYSPKNQIFYNKTDQ